LGIRRWHKIPGNSIPHFQTIPCNIATFIAASCIPFRIATDPKCVIDRHRCVCVPYGRPLKSYAWNIGWNCLRHMVRDGIFFISPSYGGDCFGFPADRAFSQFLCGKFISAPPTTCGILRNHCSDDPSSPLLWYPIPRGFHCALSLSGTLAANGASGSNQTLGTPGQLRKPLKCLVVRPEALPNV
jgi:hypothetical protein